MSLYVDNLFHFKVKKHTCFYNQDPNKIVRKQSYFSQILKNKLINSKAHIYIKTN